MELNALRALCQAATDLDLRAEGIRLLSSYRFRHPEHQLVFDVLRSLEYTDVAVLRQQLAACLTVQGFPDVDLAPYFCSLPPERHRPLALIEALLKKQGEV